MYIILHATIKADNCRFSWIDLHKYAVCNVIDKTNDSLVMAYSWGIAIPIEEMDWDN